MCFTFTIPELLYQSYLKTQIIRIKNTSIFNQYFFTKHIIQAYLFAIKLIHLHFLYIIQSTNY